MEIVFCLCLACRAGALGSGASQRLGRIAVKAEMSWKEKKAVLRQPFSLIP